MADDTSTTDTADDAAPASATGEDSLGDAGKQALDRMKAERNEAQKALKATQRELEAFRTASMSEAEKAIEAAKTEARQATLREVGGRLVEAEVRAVAAGKLADEQLAALLEGLDRSRFIKDDGDVDRDSLSQWITRLAPSSPAPPRFGDVDQGVRKSTPTASKDAADTARALFGART